MPNKGDPYKAKTKKWFIEQGYQCEYLERITWVGPGHRIPVRRDMFGADGIAISDTDIIFWNSVLGDNNIAAHVTTFKKFKFPSWVILYVVVWTKYKPEPRCIDARTYQVREYIRKEKDAKEKRS